MKSRYSPVTMLNLCIILGFLGIHRFYVGKYITAILMLLTLGGLGIWWAIDLGNAIFGNFTDKDGIRMGFDVYQNDDGSARPAGFWIRFAAQMVDSLIVMSITLVITICSVIFYGDEILEALNMDSFTWQEFIENSEVYNTDNNSPDIVIKRQEMEGKLTNVSDRINMINNLLVLLYFVLFTASAMQATPGKKLMYVYVIDKKGQRIGFFRSFFRYLSYILSAIIFMLGFVLAGITKRKTALHDLICGTYVLHGRPR